MTQSHGFFNRPGYYGGSRSNAHNRKNCEYRNPNHVFHYILL